MLAHWYTLLLLHGAIEPPEPPVPSDQPVVCLCSPIAARIELDSGVAARITLDSLITDEGR